MLRRFIPACAGNRSRRAWKNWRGPVHPRVCGEQDFGYFFGGLGGGSSPRVRGTGDVSSPFHASTRFIPACAGNRVVTQRIANPRTVHPRVCGEQAVGSVSDAFGDGSSPRVRGTATSAMREAFGDRFIPACAGNRHSITTKGPIETVHPRVCGEQLEWPSVFAPNGGSSPRVRGTDLGGAEMPLWYRFIPACAGNSRGLPTIPERQPVHPRVCGEQIGLSNTRPTISGSSPRVRGTDLVPRLAGVLNRFIPACAGNRFC